VLLRDKILWFKISEVITQLGVKLLELFLTPRKSSAWRLQAGVYCFKAALCGTREPANPHVANNPLQVPRAATSPSWFCFFSSICWHHQLKTHEGKDYASLRIVQQLAEGGLSAQGP